MCIAAVFMVFFRLPQGKIFLATIDIVAPVSSTPRHSRPPSQIRTQNTRSWVPPERPRQNSAGQVTSNPLFRNLRAILMKRLLFVRFSCNLYFRFFQSIFLIYVYKLKSAISALFWTVLVSVNQDFL